MLEHHVGNVLTVTSAVAYPSYWLELAGNEHRMNPCQTSELDLSGRVV